MQRYLDQEGSIIICKYCGCEVTEDNAVGESDEACNVCAKEREYLCHDCGILFVIGSYSEYRRKFGLICPACGGRKLIVTKFVLGKHVDSRY